jgi:hypothetical protein
MTDDPYADATVASEPSVPPRSRRFRVERFVAVGQMLMASIFAVAAALLLLAGLVGAGLFGAGCVFTQRLVDRTILSSPEMDMETLDPDRDLPGSFGSVGGGGGAGGSC